MLIDGTGIIASFVQSHRLIRGQWWRTATYATVVYLVMSICLGVFTTLVLVFSLLINPVNFHDIAQIIVRILFAYKISIGVTLMLTTPLATTLMVVYYYDLKLRAVPQEMRTTA